MKRVIYPLFAPADESKVLPILDALQKKGVSVRSRKAAAAKRDVLLLFLSQALTADSPEADEFFRLNAGRELVIPVNLDGSAPPEELQHALMARHAIFAQRYATEELSLRIKEAVPETKPLPLILSLAAALLLLAVGIFLFWQRPAPPPPPPATEVPPTPAPTEPPRVDGIDVDLTQVAEVVFMGDEFRFYTFGGQSAKSRYTEPRRNEDFAYGGWMNDGVHFYSKEDGHEYPRATLDDISWLALLPNLRFLSLYNVTAALPDLSGLTDLQGMMVGYSVLPDLEGLRGSTIQHLEYHGAGVSDFSPLTDCQNLRSAHLDLVGSSRADLSGFHPPKLTSLGLGSGFGVEGVDFSFLLQCPNLQELHIDGYPQLTDLSCLANAGKLKKLELHWTDSLRTLAGLEGAPLLEELRIDDLEAAHPRRSRGSAPAGGAADRRSGRAKDPGGTEGSPIPEDRQHQQRPSAQGHLPIGGLQQPRRVPSLRKRSLGVPDGRERAGSASPAPEHRSVRGEPHRQSGLFEGAADQE